MRKKISIFITTIIMFGLLTSCGSKEEVTTELDPEYLSKVMQGIKYETVTVSRGTLHEQISENTMIISPRTIEEFKFNFDGHLNKYYVKENKIIKKGELIAEIDTKKIEHDIMMQQFVLEREQVIYNQMISKGQNEKEIKVQELEVKIEEEKLLKLEKDKEKYKIYAPVNCYITDFNVHNGEPFKAGESLFIAAHATIPIIKTACAANMIKFENINIGDSAEIKLKYGGEYKGKVCFISSRNDSGTGGSIYFILDNESEIGAAIFEKIISESEFESKELNNRLVLPQLAVKRNGSQRYVEIIKDGVKKIRYIDCGTTGIDDKGKPCYEVLSGLKEGDVVITGTKSKFSSEM